jgi:hypothetical protein
MKQTTLYFGRNRKGGEPVSELQFAAFLRNVVSARYDGFTVVDGLGFWRGEAEKVKVLTLITPKAPDNGRLEMDVLAIEEIRDMYKAEFQQESVLQVVSNVEASF